MLLKPRVPRGIRLAFVAPATMAFAAFALGGFYAALVPGLLAQSLHQTSELVIGGIVAAFFSIASVTVVITRSLRSRSAMVVELILLLVGLGLLVLAKALHSMMVLVISTVVTAAAIAVGYRGSLHIVNKIALEEQRAEVVSSYFLVCFAANSLPVIGVGLLSLIVSASNAHRAFAIVLVVLASSACVIGLRHSPRGLR